MNCIQLTGRLTHDPVLRDDDQVTVCRLRLAVDGMGRNGETGYIDVASFGKPGRACAEHLTKGWLVAVEGRLQHGVWTAEDSSRRSAHSVIGHVEFLAAPRSKTDEPADPTQDIPF